MKFYGLCPHGFRDRMLCDDCRPLLDGAKAERPRLPRRPSEPGRGPNKHPGFVDMTAKRVGSVVVIARAPNARNGNACWFVECDCGVGFVEEGIKLRFVLKVGQPYACRRCRVSRRQKPISMTVKPGRATA